MQVKKENPDISFGEVGKALGDKWKNISASDKAKYEEMAKKDKVRASYPTSYAVLRAWTDECSALSSLPSSRSRQVVQFRNCSAIQRATAMHYHLAS